MAGSLKWRTVEQSGTRVIEVITETLFFLCKSRLFCVYSNATRLAYAFFFMVPEIWNASYLYVYLCTFCLSKYAVCAGAALAKL